MRETIQPPYDTPERLLIGYDEFGPGALGSTEAWARRYRQDVSALLRKERLDTWARRSQSDGMANEGTTEALARALTKFQASGLIGHFILDSSAGVWRIDVSDSGRSDEFTHAEVRVLLKGLSRADSFWTNQVHIMKDLLAQSSRPCDQRIHEVTHGTILHRRAREIFHQPWEDGSCDSVDAEV